MRTRLKYAILEPGSSRQCGKAVRVSWTATEKEEASRNVTSNTDPYAKGPAPGNHWVKTGPHVMIVGPAASSMGYPATADADPTKPFVMWSGTPYAHLMIPVSAQP